MIATSNFVNVEINNLAISDISFEPKKINDIIPKIRTAAELKKPLNTTSRL